MKSDNLELGKIISADQHRDAIHIAVAPVVAEAKLAPGQDIGFVEAGNTEKVGTVCENYIGIVDPFLKRCVFQGERFWMFLYPYTITSLRHDWTHPAFEPPIISLEEKWLRDFADKMDLSYGRLLEGAREYVESLERGGYGEYIIDGGRYEGASVPAEFWEHYEKVTGHTVKAEHRGTFFSCSC